MTGKSEIRGSDIRALEDKVAGDKYGQYLKRVILKKVRGFNERVVSFDFPVTAIVGPNGGGKTTILGAAGLAYRQVPPGRFFAKSGPYDESMKNWSLEFELLDRKVNARLPFQRTASFPSLKWNRKAVAREVLVFGVTRTIPATERRELVKAIGNKFAAKSEIKLSEPVVDAVEKILGKSIEGFSKLFIDSSGRVSLFAARAPGGDQYSEFHFGAGEASVIRIVSDVETASDNAMILIEEIENGLHPIATKRLVEYLIDVARRKSAQVVFTTHSNDALEPLPARAIWAAYNGEVLQGKLDIKALRTITGQVNAKLAIFVEDVFAEQMTWAVLRHYGDLEVESVLVHKMGGEGPAIKVNEQHNQDPTSSFPSVCILDGDQSEKADPSKRVFAFPGSGDPEAHIFEAVRGDIDRLAARLTLSMQLSSTHQQRVREVVEQRALTNRDPHHIFQQIGDDLDFTAENIVAAAFLAIWGQEHPDEVRALVDGFVDLIPRR